MPATGDVRCHLEIRDTVAWIWLDDFARRNALTVSLVSSLRECVDAAAVHARSIVLTHTGPHFSSGGDHAELAGLSRPELLRFSSSLMGLFAAISSSPVPVVAAGRGGAVGGGLELMLCADFALMDESAWLQLPQVSLGLGVGDYLVKVLMSRVGSGVTRRLVLTGESMDAPTAVEAGVIDELVPATELASRAGQLAKQLAGLPADGLERSRRLISEHVGASELLQASERKLYERYLQADR